MLWLLIWLATKKINNWGVTKLFIGGTKFDISITIVTAIIIIIIIIVDVVVNVIIIIIIVIIIITQYTSQYQRMSDKNLTTAFIKKTKKRISATWI